MRKGPGPGLSQVYGIVMQHGRHFSVETEEVHGTSFLIYLHPYRVTYEQGFHPAEERPVPEAKAQTILLVEDLEQLRDALGQVLESAGHDVLSVANGREALQVCGSAEQLDLVVADVVMPEVEGRLLVRELRKQHPRFTTLIITRYALEQNIEVLRQQGIIDVIRTPFDVDTLLETIRRASEKD